MEAEEIAESDKKYMLSNNFEKLSEGKLSLKRINFSKRRKIIKMMFVEFFFVNFIYSVNQTLRRAFAGASIFIFYFFNNVCVFVTHMSNCISSMHPIEFFSSNSD